MDKKIEDMLKDDSIPYVKKLADANAAKEAEYQKERNEHLGKLINDIVEKICTSDSVQKAMFNLDSASVQDKPISSNIIAIVSHAVSTAVLIMLSDYDAELQNNIESFKTAVMSELATIEGRIQRVEDDNKKKNN